MSHLAIFALGPLRIELDGRPLETSRHKALALLVYLAMRPGKQSREALSALLWPDYEQEKAYAYLRRTLWELNSLLGEGWLEADRETIGLHHSASVHLDVMEFQLHLAASSRAIQPSAAGLQECAAHLHSAALLYRGDFLAGFSLRDSTSFEDWQLFEREALRREYASALQKLVNRLYQHDNVTELMPFALRWLALDPLNEEAHRSLMKSYTLNGQRHLAVQQYQDCARLLQSELGVAPEEETCQLYEAILSEAFPGKSKLHPAADPAPTWRLPSPTMSFIGRQHELTDIGRLLADPRCWLITLLGPGGIGKTRLAVEAGARQTGQFAQGVCLVSLSVIESERSIAPAIARALELTFRQNGPAPEEQLLDFLREKRLLLILDSFEQLIQWARLLEEIHTHAPGIKMLVTSRRRLLLPGERVVEVQGLDYPPEQTWQESADPGAALQAYGAVQLFLNSAHRVRDGFQPNREDWAAIRRITQLLEGMPLTLEMAAAWISSLSCSAIADEISRGLDILESTAGEISERQRSIRAVFNHSWNLLSPRERVILPRLAVFRGSFLRQAAEQVAGISAYELSGLANQSLVRRLENGRYDLHDLLRQYLLGLLESRPSDCQATLQRHCTFYCARLAGWNEQLDGAHQGQALREIEADLENCQAAWDWAVSQVQVALVEQAADGLGKFFLRRGRLAEGLAAYAKASMTIQDAEQAGQHLQNRLLARLLIWQAVFHMNLEQHEQAGQVLQAGLRLLDDPEAGPTLAAHEWMFGLTVQGLIANLQYDPDATVRSYRQVLALSRAVNAPFPDFFIYYWRFLMGGSVSQELYQELEKNQAMVEQGGNPFEIGCHFFTLGISELYHAYRMERAEVLLEKSLQNFKQVDDPSTRMMVFLTQGYLLMAKGQFGECYDLKQQELRVVQEIGDRRMMGIAHAEIGEILCHLGRYREAEEEIRKGIALVQGRSEMEHALRHRYLGDVLLVQGKVEEARAAYLFSYGYFQSVNEKGWSMTALTGLSRAELALGDRASAWAHTREAQRLYGEIQLYTFFAQLIMANLALLLKDQGDQKQAEETYALVKQSGYLAHSRWFEDLYGKELEGKNPGVRPSL